MTFVRAWPWMRGILIAVALICAAGALVLLLRPTPGTPALALARDVQRGDAFDSSCVREVFLPEGAAPADVLAPDAPLPDVWPGEAASAGTVLSESVLAGSALGRALNANEALLSITLDSAQVPPMEPGDVVDVWGFPENCDVAGCEAQKIAPSARISSFTVTEAGAWSTSPLARIDVRVDSMYANAVLGHASTGTLTLTLRSGS